MLEKPVFRWSAILLWAAIAALCVGLYFVNLVALYGDITVPCEGRWQLNSGCSADAVSPLEADILNSWGISLPVYAGYAITIGLVSTLSYYVLGFLILWRLGVTPIGLVVSMALIVIPFSVWASGAIWADFHPALVLPGVIAVLLSNIIQTFFLLLIPNGRFSPRWAWVLMIIGIVDITFLTLHINGMVTLPANLVTVVVVIAISLVLTGIAFQVYRYLRDSTQEERQQTKWIMFGVGAYFSAIFIWVMTVGGVIDIPEGGARLLTVIIAGTVIQVLLAVLPIAITMAILRYNLWNIDIAINRSLVGLIVTAVLAVIFGVSVFIMQTILNAANPLIGLAVSAIGPILLFNPTRKRVRHFVDRRLYGFAFDLVELEEAQHSKDITNPGKLSGTKLGDYTVLDVLGKGGMGEVYKGTGNGQTVAIKTMLPDIAKDETMRTRFMREANIGKTLDHPAIASVYDSGIEDGTVYLIMEYVDGKDINQTLKTVEAFDVETATAIMTQICAALDVAHERGFVHRDLKPANVMLRENGEAVLMDFGVSKVDDASVALTGTGAIGTISYMAPEQIIAASEVQHYADIYALGVMLYEMLTGDPPFCGGAAQVMFAHLQQPAPDPRDKNDAVPDHIAEAILCAMEKQPKNRFDSAGAFAAALSMAHERV